MRKVIVLFALLISVCACNTHGGQPRLEPMARGLAEASEPVALDMKLEMSADVSGEQVSLRGVLRNISTHEIDLDNESLPWNNVGAFSVSAVAADGEVIQQKTVSAPTLLAHISAPRAAVPLGSGKFIQGSIDLGLMRIGDIPHSEDLLLLWSYRLLKDWNSDAHYTLSGVTLLKARSPTPATGSTTTELETFAGTSVPSEPFKQDLRDAPETLTINDEVIRILAFPWQGRIRLISENGTALPPTLRVKAIWMLQGGQIWNVNEIEEKLAESKTASRDFLIHDGPDWESKTPVDVVIKLHDDRGTTSFLSLRHQRMAGVE